ncbi:MAG: hypothetical protein AAFY90_00620 [Pseudomonadota bacterium]
MIPIQIALLAVLNAGPSPAQQQMTPDAFLDQAVGRTLTFSNFRSGNMIGVEQFLSRDLSVWAQEDGRCSYGHIEIRGPIMCFIYEDFPDPQNCWMPFQAGDELLVISTSSQQIQRVTAMTEDPVVCEGVPLS